MYKIDLHTHSIESPDGSLNLFNYRNMLESGGLDYAAITDHNTIEFALQAQLKLDGRIIVGEEITTAQGEIIGLYLSEAVEPGLSLADTINIIHKQGGLVYLPHPFETVRKGVRLEDIEPLVEQIDIVEIANGRAVFQDKGEQTKTWADSHKLSGAASSDAHGWHGWGRTYSQIEKVPTVDNLAKQLASAQYQKGSPGWRGTLYPKFNRLRKIGKK
jgi:predicted metal-dependent phosphoesterase TrpH